jgi:hypothetical protein
MQDGFDIWKNKLEDADAESLSESFDKEVVWRELQRKLQKRSKPIWMYAAAMLCGLLLGGVLVHLFNENTKEQVIVKKTISREKITTPAIIKGHDIQPTNEALVKNVPVVIVRTPHHTPLAKHEIQSSVTQPEIIKEPVDEVAVDNDRPSVTEQYTIEAAPLKVVHLLDIDNEDKAAIVRTANPVNAKPALVKALNELYRPEIQNDRGPKSIVSGLFD